MQCFQSPMAVDVRTCCYWTICLSLPSVEVVFSAPSSQILFVFPLRKAKHALRRVNVFFYSQDFLAEHRLFFVHMREKKLTLSQEILLEEGSTSFLFRGYFFFLPPSPAILQLIVFSC